MVGAVPLPAHFGGVRRGPAAAAAGAAGGRGGRDGDAGESPLARDEARVPQQRQAVRPAADLRLVEPRPTDDGGTGTDGLGSDDAGAAALLEVVGRLVDRARGGPGELRGDVTVADVLLVIATAAPSLPDAAQQAAASARLLDILLEGLRSRPV